MEKKLLVVVEDHQLMSQTLMLLLQARGFEVVPAKDGEEGLRLVRELAPKAILTDLHLPGLNGLELAGKLLAENSRTKVFVMSGVPNRQVYFEAVQKLGVTKCFAKPLDIHAVCEALNEAYA